MAYLLSRPIQGRCGSLAVHLVLILSISLLSNQIQALPFALPAVVKVKEANQADSQAQHLEPGKPIKQELSGGKRWGQL
jgi:hypothetical protein